MNYASVVRILSLTMIVIAACGFLPAAFAALSGEDQQVFSFLTMSTAILVVACTILLLTPRPPKKSRASDGLAVVILFWLAAPIAAALPFLIGVSNSSPISAIHEAMSCLTTTGHSVIQVDTDAWPKSLILWRGMLHLIGALASIITAVSVLAAINLGGPGIHRTVLFTIPETNFFDSIPRALRSVLVLFGGALVWLIIMQILLGAPIPRAAGDAVSAITTGLVYPGALARAPLSPQLAILLATGLFIGTLGMAFLLPFRAGRIRTILKDPEHIAFLLLLSVFAIAAILIGIRPLQAAGWSLSMLSTSGLPLSQPTQMASVPLSIAVLPAMVGGSALSAVGGVKLARLVILWSRAWQEFRQLGYRGSVLKFKFRDRELNERSVIGVWVYLIAYIGAVFACVLSFAFFGHDFDQSIRLAVGALTNSGALIGASDTTFSSGESGLMIFAMLLGRLEILALLPALSPNFWLK